MNPIIFLDIDGVLNDHTWDSDVQSGTIDRDKVQRLNHVMRTTNAKFVMSSAWRYLVHRKEMTLMGLEWLLRSHGVLANRLIGITREDTTDRVIRDRSQPPVMTNERGLQIAEWLAENPLYTHYVVLDDLDLGITKAGHPFVQTNGNVGLTDNDVEKLLSLLPCPVAS